MTPRHDGQEAKLEKTIGTIVITGAKNLVHDWKFWASTMTASGILFIRASGPVVPPATDMAQLMAAVKQLRGYVLTVKVQTQAIVDSLPNQQREQAKRLIADRMTVLNLASAQQ